MTTGASPSILGQQRSRKPSSSTEVPSAPAGAALVAAQEELRLDERLSNLPAITVDPASAPMRMPQTYGEQPPMRLSPQLDSYHPYAEMMPYPTGDGVPAHRHFQPHNSYYSRSASPYLPAPPHHPFMRLPSPSGPYTGPQQFGAGLIKGDSGLLDSDMSNPSDWHTSGYSDTGSGYPESRLQTPPVPRPPLPPKPVEMTPAGIPPYAISKPLHRVSSNPSTTTSDTLPSFDDRQTRLETRDRNEATPALLPLDEALEPPALSPLDETHESPTHVPQDEVHEPPAPSPKPIQGTGGRPTTKTLELIEDSFAQIRSIIEGLAEATGKPPSDLYRRLSKSRKGSSESHLWNIYLHYFARHEKEEAARVGKPLERSQAYRSLCYAQYKVDHRNFQELLEAYHELEIANVEMTVGHRKREVEKYEKKLEDMVS
jgi:hypothetical protein